jgi:hypothetical protein
MKENRPTIARQCELCGKDFRARVDGAERGWGRWCNRACAARARRRRVTMTCSRCGATFETHPSQVEAGRGIYCSRFCHRKVHERPCRTCGKPFTPTAGNAARGYGFYCGRPCYITGREARRPSLETRFWKRVAKSEGCWLWTGTRYKKGYGRFSYGRNSGILATHFAWQLAHGPIPPDMKLCHTCDTPSCVRIDHLFLGTSADNSADMVAKGRQTFGSRNPMAAFTDDQVIEIRRRYRERESKMVDLAREFGVSRGTVSAIVSGRTWRHLLPETQVKTHY